MSFHLSLPKHIEWRILYETLHVLPGCSCNNGRPCRAQCPCARTVSYTHLDVYKRQANISAREIVVLGKVRGNLTASDRVDIRSDGSLTGDVVAARISIEDGAFFTVSYTHLDVYKRQSCTRWMGSTPTPSEYPKVAAMTSKS